MQQLKSTAALNPPPPSPSPSRASSTSPQTQLPSSALASTPPLSTAVPPAPSRSPSPAPTSSSTTSTSPRVHSRPQTPAASSQAPAACVAGPQKKFFLSSFFSALWSILQEHYQMIIKGLFASAIAILGVCYAVLQFPYTKWTQHNDFRDGCINDLEHNLTLAVECYAELERPRVSSVVWKRSFETVHTALTHRPELGITIDVAIGCIALGLAVISTGVAVHHQARSYSRPPRDVADKDARGTASARFSEDMRNRNRPSGMGTSRYNFQKSRVTTSGLANV
jgi:hypothetical protein